MKILYIAHSSGLQGAGIALLNLIKGIVHFGVIPVVVLPDKGELYDQLVDMNVTTYIVPFKMDTYPRSLKLRDKILFFPKFLYWLLLRCIIPYRLGHIIKKEQINIIHTNTSVIQWGESMAKKLSIPHVWHIRECQDLGLNYKPIGGMEKLKSLMCGTNNNCVAITQAVFNHHRLDKLKDLVIYDGVFHEEIAKRAINPYKSNYFIFVGALTKMKGVFDVIDAFNVIQSKYNDAELWLAGLDSSNVAEYIKTLPCKHKIKLLGFRKDIYALMRKAKALIVASYFEGFGFVTTEAMINGCLVIGRNTGGTKEQFDFGLNKLEREIALRFEDKEDLIRQMDYAYSISDDTMLSIVTDAKEIASTYTIENNTKRIYNLYKMLLYEK